jgi:transposase-like protein
VTASEHERRFPTDDACLEFLKERACPAGTACPACKKRSRFHRIAGRSAYSCQYCGHHVYPTAGTIFHKSRTSLMLWFRAVELVRTSGARVTARDLERELGVSYKTALRMNRQVRLLLDEEPDPLGSGDALPESECAPLSRQSQKGIEL